jgi:prepilin-type N-terminal cleavage/methylation domain-containing protein
VDCGPRPYVSESSGFTLMELVIVLLIGSVLAGIAVPGFARLRERRAAMNARDAYVWMAALARAQAIESGGTVALTLDPAANAAFILVGADTLQRVNFLERFGAEVDSEAGTVTVCYVPRGFALQASCSLGLPADIGFVRGTQESWVRVRTLGQVERT